MLAEVKTQKVACVWVSEMGRFSRPSHLTLRKARRDDWWWKLKHPHICCVRSTKKAHSTFFCADALYLFSTVLYLISDDDISFFELTVRITVSNRKEYFLRLCLSKIFPIGNWTSWCSEMANSTWQARKNLNFSLRHILLCKNLSILFSFVATKYFFVNSEAFKCATSGINWKLLKKQNYYEKNLKK